MSERPAAIIFKFIFLQKEEYVSTYPGEYRSLMELIYDKFYIEDFGECKGIGRCGTCAVNVVAPNNVLAVWEGNEEATLIKMGIHDPSVRLSCQIMINEQLNDTVIRLL
jgi:2Fe-2S ferredoxin